MATATAYIADLAAAIFVAFGSRARAEVMLLVFGLVVGLGILAAAPTLLRGRPRDPGS